MSGRRRRKPSRPKPGGPSVPDRLYPTLDLHGRTADEATHEAGQWLLARQAAGEATVRLITGRGLHSVGPPVLPDAIDALLRRLQGRVVRRYEREPGGGAYRVQLDRLRTEPPTEPRVGPLRTGALEPELVRLAEEALSELGVASTPALVEAEVRRILRDRARAAGRDPGTQRGEV